MVKVITAVLVLDLRVAAVEERELLVKTVTQEQPIMAVMAVLALIILVHIEAAAVVALLGLTMLQALHLAARVAAATVELLITPNIVAAQLILAAVAVLLGVRQALKMVVLVL